MNSAPFRNFTMNNFLNAGQLVMGHPGEEAAFIGNTMLLIVVATFWVLSLVVFGHISVTEGGLPLLSAESASSGIPHVK